MQAAHVPRTRPGAWARLGAPGTRAAGPRLGSGACVMCAARALVGIGLGLRAWPAEGAARRLSEAQNHAAAQCWGRGGRAAANRACCGRRACSAGPGLAAGDSDAGPRPSSATAAGACAGQPPPVLLRRRPGAALFIVGVCVWSTRAHRTAQATSCNARGGHLSPDFSRTAARLFLD